MVFDSKVNDEIRLAGAFEATVNTAVQIAADKKGLFFAEREDKAAVRFCMESGGGGFRAAAQPK